MVKPGDVVEFKAGLLGIDAPQNLAILLDRKRRKGVPWVRLVTMQGIHEIKAEHLSGRAFKARYDGRLGDTGEVQARLKHLIGQHAGGDLTEEAVDDLEGLEATLWERAADQDRTWTEPELAALIAPEPSAQQLKDVRAALERCRRPGVGRFETAGKGDLWRPWTRDELAAMRQAWDGVQALRGRLIEVQDGEDGRMFVRRDVTLATFTEAERATLGWVAAAMAQYIDHDGVPDTNVAGIAGFGVTQAFAMDLHRQLGFLAQDWIRSPHTSRSSDYLHFLLELGIWGPDEAVAALTRRHVNREDFFEHKPDEQAQTDALALSADTPLGDRTDLRGVPCYTIDPPDAKDFDDAVGLETRDDGTRRLWVHVADVSHYVRPGTHLDRHARMRATSVYLPGRVLPMLPHRIADQLCSLRDDGDRYALSASLDVDPAGKVQATAFHISLIRVTENLSYGEALRRRDAGDPAMSPLFALAADMRRHRRGLALETGEVRVQLEADAFSTHVKRPDDATQMIETFMVAANEAVAKHLADADVPLLFRCHPLPEAAKAERYQHQLRTMGLDVDFRLPEAVATKADASQSLLDALKAGGGKMQLFGGGMDLPAKAEPEPEVEQGFAALSDAGREAWLAPFRDVVERLRALGSERAEVATIKLLACLGRAFYAPSNEGHFGLGSTHYCHFTSPIRRYPDLVVHRNLKAHLRGEPLPHAAEDLERRALRPLF